MKIWKFLGAVRICTRICEEHDKDRGKITHVSWLSWRASAKPSICTRTLLDEATHESKDHSDLSSIMLFLCSNLSFLDQYCLDRPLIFPDACYLGVDQYFHIRQAHLRGNGGPTAAFRGGAGTSNEIRHMANKKYSSLRILLIVSTTLPNSFSIACGKVALRKHHPLSVR